MKRAPVLPLAALFVAVAALLPLARDARAGALQIRDDAHVLSAADAARLRSVVDASGFDARLVFTDQYADAQSLSRFVGSLVSEPDMIAVGVEPRERHVEVHFGTGSGIARTQWAAIEQAGNASFRDGHWEAGAAAIFRAASAASTGAPGARSLPQADHSPSFAGSGLFLLLLIAGVIAVVALVARRRSGYGGGGYEPGSGAGPYGGYGPSGGPGGVGPLGGGLIGAGLGGLAGYELGKAEGEREERGGGAEPRDSGGGPGDDFDAGGGGSSWDGSADDSGGDGGGDSGGGSDF